MCPIVSYCIMHAMFSVSTVLHYYNLLYQVNLMWDGALQITTHDITVMATCNLACTELCKIKTIIEI